MIVFSVNGEAYAYEKLTTASATGLTSSVYAPASKRLGECLTNGALTSGTSWTGANDFSASGNKAVYSHSSGAGTFTQSVTALALTLKGYTWYELTYTVSSPSGTAPTIVISTGVCEAATALTNLDVAGTYKVLFYTKQVPGDFVLSGTSGGAGAVSLDDLSVKEVVIDWREGLYPVAALVTVETASVNITIDGSTPTLSANNNVGHTLSAGQSYVLKDPNEIRKFRVINSVNASGAVVKVTYYR